MDEKDKKIIKTLKENARFSTRDIAKRTKIPISTVHKRIQKLIKEKIIKKFTIELNNQKVGNNFHAYILISTNLDSLKQKKKSQYDVLKELKKISIVEKSNIIIGEADLIIEILAKDVIEFEKILLNKIQNIEGISNTKTLMVIKE